MLSIDVRGKIGEFDLSAKFDSTGSVTALFGRSGTGKTTLTNMISGLYNPISGSIRLGDVEFYNSGSGTNLSVQKRRVGHVFQENRLFPHFSVKRNLTFAKWAGQRVPDRPFDEVVTLLGLEKLLTRLPDTLSGGEKQRVSIGRALLSQPRVLVMDEPLSSLDDARKSEILPYLDELCQNSGIPIVYVSHALGEVARLGNYLVVLSEGKVMASGPVSDVMTRLDLGPIVDRFEASSLLNARVVGFDEHWQLTKLDVEGQIIELPIKGKVIGEIVRLRILARDVSLATKKPKDISIRNQLLGSIIEMRNESGPFSETVCAVGQQRIRVRLTRASVDELKIGTGSKVYMLMKSISFDHS